MPNKPPSYFQFPASGNRNARRNTSREKGLVVRTGQWAAIFGVLTLIVTAAIWPVRYPINYEATAVVKVDLDEQSGIMRIERRTIQVELAKLKLSEELYERMATSLVRKAETNPEIRSYSIFELNDATRDDEGEDLVSQLGESAVIHAISRKLYLGGDYLDAKLLGDDLSSIILTGKGNQPAEAIYLANLFADEYQKWSQEQEKNEFTETFAFFVSQQNKYNEALRASQDTLASYRQIHKTVSLSYETSQVMDGFWALDFKLEAVMIKLMQQQAERRILESQLNEIRPQLVDALASNATTKRMGLQQQLFELENEFIGLFERNPNLHSDGSNLTGRQLEDWSQIQQLRIIVTQLVTEEAIELSRTSVISGWEEGVQERLKTLATQLNLKKNEVDRLEYQRGYYQEQIALYKERYRIADMEPEVFKLTREVNKYAHLLSSMSEQLAAMELAQARIESRVQITNYATTSNIITNDASYKPRTIILGMILGLLLSFSIVGIRAVFLGRKVNLSEN